MAGLLKYAPEFTLVTNQYVNSYKRLQPDSDAPTACTWANRNRHALLRVPLYKPGKEIAARFELRSPDPACNPYLAFAVMLAAGLKGIKEGLELGPEAAVESQSTQTLPRNLGEAVELFEGSELMKEVLGEHTHNYILSAKKDEWTEYSSTVSKWELDKYLAIL